jgi:hypothetical protein
MDSLSNNTSISELDLRNNQELSDDAHDAILDALDFAPHWSAPPPLPATSRVPGCEKATPATVPVSQNPTDARCRSQGADIGREATGACNGAESSLGTRQSVVSNCFHPPESTQSRQAPVFIPPTMCQHAPYICIYLPSTMWQHQIRPGACTSNHAPACAGAYLCLQVCAAALLCSV